MSGGAWFLIGCVIGCALVLAGMWIGARNARRTPFG